MTVAEAMTMPKYVNMLCWGGPEHGKVVAADPSHGVVLFAVERRTHFPLDVTSPIGPSIQTVRYDVERVRFRGDEWFVLVYPENKERHQQRLADVMNGIAQLCAPVVNGERYGTHAIGEPCDICDGRGFDYIGRPCRRLVK